jgi:hypothetical protein
MGWRRHHQTVQRANAGSAGAWPDGDAAMTIDDFLVLPQVLPVLRHDHGASLDFHGPEFT